MSNAKQVIVVRNDLRNKSGQKIRSGKMAAQVAHASIGALLSLTEDWVTISGRKKGLNLIYKKDDPVQAWLEGKFTKICLYVESEEALLDLHKKVQEANLPCALIQDAGLTEFDKPTYTCLGIGPSWEEDIDKFTGTLPLY